MVEFEAIDGDIEVVVYCAPGDHRRPTVYQYSDKAGKLKLSDFVWEGRSEIEDHVPFLKNKSFEGGWQWSPSEGWQKK